MTSKEKKLAKKEEKEKKYSQLVHAAIRRGSMSDIKKLLKKVAPSVPNSAEQTPLHTAAIEGHEDIVQYLLQRKRVSVNAQDRDGWTPLHCACHSNHLLVVDALISHGAEVTIETGNGLTALDYFVRMPAQSTAPEHFERLFRTMIRKGASVNRANPQGDYLLHTAAFRGKEKSVSLLLLNQARPNALNRHGETALHLATRGGYLGCIRLLLEVKADWSIVGPHGHCIQAAKAAKNSAVLPLYRELLGDTVVEEALASVQGVGSALALGDSPGSELTLSPSGSSALLVASPPGSTVMSPKGSAVREDMMDMEESFLPLAHESSGSPLMARSLPLFDSLPTGSYNLATPALTDSPTPSGGSSFTSSSYEVRTLRRSDDLMPDPLLSPTETTRRLTASSTSSSPARSRSHSKTSGASPNAKAVLSTSIDVGAHLARTKTPRGRSQSRQQGSSPTSRRTSRSFSPLPEIHHVRSPPKSVGPYSIGDCVGSGSFGSVFTAFDQNTGSLVAVKQISLAGTSADGLSVVMAEMELLKRMDYKHITKYLGFYQDEANLYIILELIEGGSLATIINKYGGVAEPLCARYITQTLLGLAYLHCRHIIHRDIKCANILVTKDGLVKLADFGIASVVEAKENSHCSALPPQAPQQLEREEDATGSPYWMAPEVVQLQGASTASDIWSLGCTIIELLTGAPPYSDVGPMAALFAMVKNDHPPFPPQLSPELEDFLHLCFRSNPQERASVKELLGHRWVTMHAADIDLSDLASFGSTPLDGSSS